MKLISKFLAASVALSLSTFGPVIPAIAQEGVEIESSVLDPLGAMTNGLDAAERETVPNPGKDESREWDLTAAQVSRVNNFDASMGGAADNVQDEGAYDKADFYSDAGQWCRPYSFSTRAASVHPMYLSDEMKYFAKYESSCNYNQGFGAGDGYHALGYYQFDHRYGLKEFLLACYAYDSVTYSMFAQFASVSDADFKSEDAIRKNGSFTDLGNRLNDAWHAAYWADSSEFSALQDGWAYQSYYLPAEIYLASRGVDISNRADCVKGLCWGISNLFGTSGWRKFVGGVSDGYDWNGVYHYLSEGYNWPGCGLRNSMSDQEFVTTLCNYIVDNVAVFYRGTPQYHKGWQNRYRNELKDCMSLLGSWVPEGSDWRYYIGGTYLANTWKRIGEVWYWFDFNGYAANDGLQRVDGLLYYFDDTCRMYSDEWAFADGEWYWLSSSGPVSVGWQHIDATWYHFSYGTGAMQTSWIFPDGQNWYYLDESGAMQMGWIIPDGTHWFYLDESGAMVVGWYCIDDYRFFFDDTGAMRTGWQDIENRRYYFSEWGDGRTNWTLINGLWYWFDDEGVMGTGWIIPDGTHWFYLNDNGVMRTGWQFLGESWYYFSNWGDMLTECWVGDYYVQQNGTMATDAWIGGYYVGVDGKWDSSRK